MYKMGRVMREKEIENFIKLNPLTVGCQEIIGTQVPMGLGLIDVVGIVWQTTKPTIRLVEIKWGRIDCKAVGQLTRYMFAMSESPLYETCYLEGVLVGQSYDYDALILCNELEYLPLAYSGKGDITTKDVGTEILWDSITTKRQASIDRTVQRLERYATDFTKRHSKTR